MFTAGVRQEEIDQIKTTTNRNSGTLPIRYPGVPLCTKNINLEQCSSLIQSIKSQLHSWTVIFLSFFGRLQLISFVISGITNFWTSTFILPKGCLTETDSLCARFLWKEKIDGQASTKVAWESLIFSK